MTAKTEKVKVTSLEWLPPLFRGYIYLTAALLVVIGAMLFLVIWTCKVRVIQSFLNAQAPFLGFSNRATLLLAGVLHLVFGGWLFVTRDLMNQGLLALWAGLNHFIYRMAMIWLTTMAAPFPIEYFVGWRLGVRPETVDLCWKLLIAYLLFGSSVFMLLNILFNWRQEKQLKDEAWVKHWQDTRDQFHSEAKTVSQEAPAIANDYLKISCPHCAGHIAFPSQNLGQMIPCPHCNMNITLKEPT
jgi:hypothetical protein